jgi:hypothetical protein
MAFGRRYLEKMRGLTGEDAHIARVNDLLARIKVKLPQLEELFAQIEDRSGEEDGGYRFYHHSFKVFDLQKLDVQQPNCRLVAGPVPQPGGKQPPLFACRKDSCFNLFPSDNLVWIPLILIETAIQLV